METIRKKCKKKIPGLSCSRDSYFTVPHCKDSILSCRFQNYKKDRKVQEDFCHCNFAQKAMNVQRLSYLQHSYRPQRNEKSEKREKGGYANN
jgi:hypothetical protein